MSIIAADHFQFTLICNSSAKLPKADPRVCANWHTTPLWHPSLANDPDGLVLEVLHTLIALLGLHHVALKLLDLEVLGVTRVSLEAQLHHHLLPLPELLIGLGQGMEQLIGHTTGLVPPTWSCP